MKTKTILSSISVDLARTGKGLKSQPFRKASDIVSAWIDIKVKWSISDTRKTSREKEQQFQNIYCTLWQCSIYFSAAHFTLEMVFKSQPFWKTWVYVCLQNGQRQTPKWSLSENLFHHSLLICFWTVASFCAFADVSVWPKIVLLMLCNCYRDESTGYMVFSPTLKWLQFTSLTQCAGNNHH